jgi:DNA ligase-1
MKKILYAKDSVGKIRIWTIEVVATPKGADINTSHGIVGGKMVTKTEPITSGKNIGRANETTPLEQAISEATSSWQNQKDTGYFESIKRAETTQVYLPMLAHMFSKRKHDITYPAYVQPKLDGVRCLVKKVNSTTLHFMSRGGKDYDTMQRHPMVKILLDYMKEGDVLDGEIYKHGWSLQKITSMVKKFKPESLELEYWIFDVPSDETFEDRFVSMKKSKALTFVETIKIKSEADVQIWHDKYVQNGFEGVIIRNTDGLYKFGERSADLQKYKEFIDDEFEITGWEVEKQNINGEDYKCIVYVCKTKDGTTFKCRPRGSLKNREELLKVADKLIGKNLTVRYQALTDDTEGEGKKVPQFPVGICIRDYEE